MQAGLQKTLDVLASSNNESAVEVLVAGLAMPQRDIREGSLRALLKRPNNAGQRELVRQWNSFSAHWKSIIAERPNSLIEALAEALRGNDPQLGQNSANAILRLREYDLTSVLLGVLENKSNPISVHLGKTLLTLAESLYEELASPRDYRHRRDPQAVRQFMLSVLDPATGRFSSHQRPEIIEAFLILANRDNITLKKLLQCVDDSAHSAVVDILAHSPRPGVIRLLLNFLDDPQTPNAALNILANRRDLTFLRHLLKRFTADVSSAVKFNLKRIDNIGWLKEIGEILSSLNDTEHVSLVTLLMYSGVSREASCDALRAILRRGGSTARADAVTALKDFRQKEVREDILLALSDPEPQVQANALLQLRDRHVPGAMDRLLDALESPSDIVRKTVQQCLSEFSFIRYMAAFEKLNDEVKKTTGKLVHKLDPSCVESLQREFASDSRTRRLRAVEITLAMEIAPLVESELLDLLQDEDHFLLMRGIEAISACHTPRVKRALQKLLAYEHEGVCEAARIALTNYRDVVAPPEETELPKTPEGVAPLIEIPLSDGITP